MSGRSSKPLRLPRSVLMTTDTVGGVWNFSLELARGLAASGVEVHLAAMGGWMSTTQRAELAKIPNVEAYEGNFRLEWMPDCWNDVRRAGEWLLHLESRFAPDVIHLNGYAHGSLSFNAPLVVTAHSCVLSWWKAVKGVAAPAEYDEYRKQVSAGLQAADVVTAPTRTMLASVEELYGPLHNVRVIPNGRDRALFQPGRKEPFVLAAGRLWDEAKNISALDRVAQQLRWPVCVAGEATIPGEGRFQSTNIAALGKLDAQRMAQEFSRASIFAHPAKYEPFGLAVLEAALSGCALVLGDIDSLRENWDGAAAFVNPNDPVALRGCLNKLIENSSERDVLAEQAQTRALGFPATAMISAYYDVYAGVLRGAEENVRSCA